MSAAAALDAALSRLGSSNVVAIREFLFASPSCRESDVARLSRAPCDALVALNLCVDVLDHPKSRTTNLSSSVESFDTSSHDSVQSILLYPENVHDVFETGICVQRTRKKSNALDADDLALQNQEYHVALGRFVRNIETHDITCVVDAGCRPVYRANDTQASKPASVNSSLGHVPALPECGSICVDNPDCANVSCTSRAASATNAGTVPVLRLQCVRSITDTTRWVYTALFDANRLRSGGDEYSALLASEAALLQRPSCNLCGSDGRCSSLCSAAPEPLKPPRASLKDAVTSHASRSGHVFRGEAVACFCAPLESFNGAISNLNSSCLSGSDSDREFVTSSRQISVRTERLHNSELANLLRHSAVRLCLDGGMCSKQQYSAEHIQVPATRKSPVPEASTKEANNVHRQSWDHWSRKRSRYVEESCVTEEGPSSHLGKQAVKYFRPQPVQISTKLRHGSCTPTIDKDNTVGRDPSETEVPNKYRFSKSEIKHEPGKGLALVRNPVFPVDLKPVSFHASIKEESGANDGRGDRLSSLFHQMPTSRRLLSGSIRSLPMSAPGFAQPFLSSGRPALPPLQRSQALSSDPRASRFHLPASVSRGGDSFSGDSAGPQRLTKSSLSDILSSGSPSGDTQPALSKDEHRHHGAGQYFCSSNQARGGWRPTDSMAKHAFAAGHSPRAPLEQVNAPDSSALSRVTGVTPSYSAFSAGISAYKMPPAEFAGSNRSSVSPKDPAWKVRYNGSDLAPASGQIPDNNCYFPPSSSAHVAPPCSDDRISTAKLSPVLPRSLSHVPPTGTHREVLGIASVDRFAGEKFPQPGGTLSDVPSTVQQQFPPAGVYHAGSRSEREIHSAASLPSGMAALHPGAAASSRQMGTTPSEEERAAKRLSRKMKNREAAARSNLKRKQRDDALKAAVHDGRDRLRQLRETHLRLLEENASMKALLGRLN